MSKKSKRPARDPGESFGIVRSYATLEDCRAAWQRVRHKYFVPNREHDALYVAHAVTAICGHPTLPKHSHLALICLMQEPVEGRRMMQELFEMIGGEAPDDLCLENVGHMARERAEQYLDGVAAGTRPLQEIREGQRVHWRYRKVPEPDHGSVRDGAYRLFAAMPRDPRERGH